jgi:hypothetical protein|tara:strand:+ start:1171 stop:1359 length:189 start_codon:yes stop_codon:yes gene_type:complete
MNRLEKLKKDHIKEVNRRLDEGFKSPEPEERPIVLKPSANVTNLSEAFITKMNNLGAANKCV